MGGCGKSQLALEFCHQAKVNRWFSAIFWVDASSPTTAAQSYLTIAREFFNAETDGTDPLAGVAIVQAQMKRLNVSWLLVLDNFDEPSAFSQHPIQEFFLDSPKGFVLVTSRDATTQRLGRGIPLSGMLAEEALDLLFASSGLSKDDKSIEDGNAVVDRLGCLALAVDQAGAYIQVRGIDFSTFLVHFDHRRDVILKETPSIWSYKRKLGEEEAEQALSVATTWELSLEQISGDHEERESKKRLLTVAAFFNNQCISEVIFVTERHEIWRYVLRHRWDHYAFGDAISELRKLHLVQTQFLSGAPGEMSFSIHPMVRDWIKLRLTKEDLISHAIEAIKLLGNCIFLNNELRLQVRQEIILHIHSVGENKRFHLGEDTQFDEFVIGAHYCFANFLLEEGKYVDAEVLCTRVLVWARENLHAEHFLIFKIMETLATINLVQGRIKEAEELQTQVVDYFMRVYGSEHKSTLISQNRRAVIYLQQKQWAKVEELEVQVIEINSRVRGMEDAGTLTSMLNLAQAYMGQKRWKKAEELTRQVVDVSSGRFGPEHYLVMKATYTLASAYSSQGKWEQAEKMYVKVMEVVLRVRGHNHPNTLMGMCNLAIAWEALGRDQEAMDLMEEAAQRMEAVLGSDHPDTEYSV